MNQELLNNLYEKVIPLIGGGDVSLARKVNLLAKVMEVVEKGTSLSGPEKKKYATELVKMIYERLGSSVSFESEELSETIDTLVGVGKGLYELQKKTGLIKNLKKCCKK